MSSSSESDSSVKTTTITDSYNSTVSTVNNLTDVGSIHVGADSGIPTPSANLIVPIVAMLSGLALIVLLKK